MFRAKFFLTHNFFRNKSFLRPDPNFSDPKIFLEPKFFSCPTFFLTQNFLRTFNLWDQHLFNTWRASTKDHHLTKSWCFFTFTLIPDYHLYLKFFKNFRWPLGRIKECSLQDKGRKCSAWSKILPLGSHQYGLDRIIITLPFNWASAVPDRITLEDGTEVHSFCFIRTSKNQSRLKCS